jgi:hypothetical protein
MLVKFVLLARRGDLSHAAFAAHWRGPHATLLGGLEEHRALNLAYVQNLVVTAPGEPAVGDADGIAQTWPRDAASLEAGFHESPRYAALVLPDVRAFVDTGRTRIVYAARQRAFGAQRPGGAKLLGFLRAPEGVAPAPFVAAWCAAQAAALQAQGLAPLLRGVALHGVVKTQAPGQAEDAAGGAAGWCHAVAEIRCVDDAALHDLLTRHPPAALAGAGRLVALHAVREAPIYGAVPDDIPHPGTTA